MTRVIPLAVSFQLAVLAAASLDCASCHASIYREYMKSAMATSSGALAPQRVIEKLPAVVEHGGTRMRVSMEGTRVAFPVADTIRTLDYFIGSGAVGRSYATSVSGFLFQSPVSWYSSASQWALSPGFEKSTEVNLLRAVEPGCLRCHASGLQPVEGSANGYGTPAFLEAGVSCERCHGPGETHIGRVKAGQKGGIVNPAKLDPVRRDSVCAQCHLSGAVELSRSGGAGTFRAGDVLSEKSITFVWDQSGGPMPVISHFERMAQSRCRQAAPERLWCGTCHNPHTAGTDYRAKCLTCHTESHCTGPVEARSKVADSCTTCHMPRTSAASVQHAVFTDHSIPRRPRQSTAGRVPVDAVLRPFGDAVATDRELALAWADLALRENNRTWGARAFGMLQAAYKRDPKDAKVASQLAQLFDRMGQEARACGLYARVLELDPAAIAPAINLGACLAKQGRIDESMRLWTDVLQRSPGQEGARLNLAVAQFQTGDIAAARATLTEALKLNPLSRRARELLGRMESATR